ncbi:MAG: NAD-dependent epimerase/dehydratase family protein [Fimbriimonadaceae bacterium]|nr:NAD-dependent epimerase/dehydratase family protein [Fimbriimonadaceae bacterium]
MRVLVIGGTGHIGSYLVPRLVAGGHQVTVVARHAAPQYTDPRLGWPAVQWVVTDRRAEEAAGTWPARLASLEADAVIDLIGYTPAENRQMVEAFGGRISHFLHCGTIWAYGAPERLPYRESDPRRPQTQYGLDKAAIEAELLQEWRANGFPATVIHPGHISGRRWLPIDPQGTRNGVEVYRKLATGAPVPLPAPGQATLHHVHGDDVAQLFELALTHREPALGQSFSAVAPYALTLLACARYVASLFGREANVELVSAAAMEAALGPAAWAATADHLRHSPCCSIAHGQRRLGYQPRFTTEQIYDEAVDYLLSSGQLVL